jgi:iron complex outermembrane receptor protein
MFSSKRNAFRVGLGAVIGGLFAVGPNATAQEAQGAGELDEVIVTAERVQSTAQRTAISMEVMDSDAIKSEGVTSIHTLSQVSPSVNVTGFGGGTVVTVRGISSRDTTEIGDPAVVVSYDGFYQDRSYALNLTQYDMERIEILRGPQGTLYGRNATGGAINVYTTRPGKEKGGYVLVDGGSFNTLNTEGAVNLPISNSLSMRASFASNYHGAYRSRQNSTLGGVDDANARSGRLSFLYEPNEQFSLRFTAQQTVQTALGSAPMQIPYRTDANGWVLHDLPTLQDPKNYTKYFNSRLNLNDTMFRYDMVYRAPWATITYLGGYDKLSWNSLLPGAAYINGPATNANPNPTYRVQVYNQTEKPETINQELRFASASADSALQWQFGVYYFKNHNLLDSFNQAPNGTLAPTPLIHFIYDVEIKSLAAMAQVSYKLSDNFKVTGGFRNNDDQKSRQGYFGPFNVRPPTQPLVISPGSDIKKDTYSFGLDYQITPDNLLYAKYGTGYKSGGFTDIAEYGPEEVKTTEFGSKNRFFDNRMEANIALYNSDYSGQQVQQIVQGGGGLRIVNAGATRLRGAEGDFAWATASGRVELNFAYLDAEFTDFRIPATTARWNGTAWVNSTPLTSASAPYMGPNAVLMASATCSSPATSRSRHRVDLRWRTRA